MLTSFIQEIAQNIPVDFKPFIAKIVGTEPLSIQVDQDKKINPSEKSIIVLRNLTNHTVDITVQSSSINSDITNVSVGDHGNHTHEINSIDIQSGVMTIKNAIKVGDVVFGLYYKGKYILVERVGKL